MANDDDRWHPRPRGALRGVRFLSAERRHDHPDSGAPRHLLRVLLRDGLYLRRRVFSERHSFQRARFVQPADPRRGRAARELDLSVADSKGLHDERRDRLQGSLPGAAHYRIRGSHRTRAVLPSAKDTRRDRRRFCGRASLRRGTENLSRSAARTVGAGLTRDSDVRPNITLYWDKGTYLSRRKAAPTVRSNLRGVSRPAYTK